jgi:O-phospho-L-seryl-tRNASec:L-selenocysteinyl-tRNA synthase
MDSNNAPDGVGVGEREARVACPLVARRHYGLAHGIGRSGDLTAEQPKAAGSSLLAKLAALLAADALRAAGLPEVGPATVLPCATGMAMTLTLMALKPTRPGAECVAPRPPAARRLPLIAHLCRRFRCACAPHPTF